MAKRSTGKRKADAPSDQTVTKEMTVEKAVRLIALSVAHRRKWREKARENYRFVAGDQWAADDRNEMDKKLRPRVTFNEVGPITDAVTGHEIANRQEVTYSPRKIGAAGVSEVLTAAAEWVREECDAEQEESSAFYDLTICGEGWTDTEIDYDQDLDGRIEECRVNPLEMDVDSLSTKKNYADAKWLARSKVYDRNEARERWPDAKFEAVEFQRNSDAPVDVVQAAFYHTDSGKDGRGPAEEGKVLIHDFQWWEHEYVYRVPLKLLSPEQGFILMHGFAMEEAERAELAQTEPPEDRPLVDPEVMKPDPNGLVLFDQEAWDKVKDVIAPIQPMRQKRRCYHRMYLSASELLEKKKTPTGKSFSYNAMTAKRNNDDNTWYGLVEAMKDPQRWANKFMSSSLEQIATSAKGGILYEAKAFANIRKAEDDWADPSRNVEMVEGALSGPNPKVMPRPVNNVPQGMYNLMDYCRSRIAATAGVNQEVMGLSEAMDPSGILEEGRKQSGLNMLSYLFDGLRLFRKQQGRMLLDMIRMYIPQGRLIRLEGPDGAQYVPLVYDDGTAEYDVRVDEAPTAPDVKQRTWDSAMAIAEHAPNAIPAQAWPLLLEYAPFPASLVQKLKAAIQQAQKQAQSQPNPEAILAQAKAGDLQAGAALKQAQAQKLSQEGPLQQAIAAMEYATERLRAQAEATAANAKIETAGIEAATARQTAPLELAKTHADAFKSLTHAFVAGHKAVQEHVKTTRMMLQPAEETP